MKKTLILIALLIGIASGAKALTYEEAFDSIKAIPEMKDVNGTLVSGDNDFAAVGITDGQLVVWIGETYIDKETEVYGNILYKIMGELPAAEMVQCRADDQNIMAIFAKRISADNNRILILSDSARDGFTGALIGYINNENLDNFRKAILIPREGGGTALYLNALNF